ncbi:hypothetical protein BDZ45DRAFT_283696 [Acephala macrosclerotiorum]|nr:hypothetical protein BDZ45DRAFT_283696 [Acephala macrosclerotiorum]
MLPEGHTPGDKTLYLLARLSKEVDSTKAGQLLAEEINRRCKDMLAETNSRIVTNADVQNVLNNVSPTNRRGTTAHSEPSPSAQTPQSSRLTAGAKPNSSSQSKKQLTTISKDNTKASPSNSQKSQAASLQKFFTPALQVWLDTTSTHHLHPNSPTTTILALPPPELRRMESTILQHSKSAGIAGVDYCKATPAELKKLKGYLAGLTLELSSEFEFPGVRRGEDVVDIFMAIYAMFLHGNSAMIGQGKQKMADPQAANTGSTSPMKEIQPNVAKSAMQKRKRSDEEVPEPTKWRKPNRRQSLPQRVNELRHGENQQLPVETDASMIHADARPSPEVKSDEDTVEEENIYDATPPPRTKRKPGKSAPS